MSLLEYDPAGDRWRQMEPPFPGLPRQRALAFSTGSQFWVIGGFNNNRYPDPSLYELWEFDFSR